MTVSRLLIVEDHPVMRETYRMLFSREPAVDVVGVAATAEEALEQMEGLRPDIALVDISLPQMNGLQLVPQLRARRPELKIVVVTGHHEPQYRDAALAAGADAFVRKGRASTILNAIHELLGASSD
jgi:DNA-binding NarL/FixJ family response regulator